MNGIATIRIDRLRRNASFAAAAGFAILLISLCIARPRAFQAYWIAWIFWSGIGFGSLVMLMLHTLTGGAWGEAVRAPAEAAAMTLPLMALLFVPALFGLGDLFPWTHPVAFAGHDWPHKRAYLTAPWFAVRSLGYFVVLGGLTVLLGLWTHSGALRTRYPNPPTRAAALGASGLITYFVLMLFASTDWVVSLEPQWYSTMFVVIFAVDHFLAALALAVVVATHLPRAESPLTTKQLHDLGNLLLAFVIFWAYVTFSQFLIIWSGNLPREISWYLHRAAGGWPAVTIVLVAVQFAVPFVLLLSRAAKRHQRVLGPIAALILLANAVHVWWLIAPSFQPSGVPFPFLEVAAFVGIGGVWSRVFLGFLQHRPPPLAMAQPPEVAHA
ncbi:MAG: hypothetical protein QOE70_5624 [Chthoniobacter sp.]|jgi:hypothetical protein|nr:hypothetical protein [Chthoniobacter sp.]